MCHLTPVAHTYLSYIILLIYAFASNGNKFAKCWQHLQSYFIGCFSSIFTCEIKFIWNIGETQTPTFNNMCVEPTHVQSVSLVPWHTSICSAIFALVFCLRDDHYILLPRLANLLAENHLGCVPKNKEPSSGPLHKYFSSVPGKKELHSSRYPWVTIFNFVASLLPY